jgi:hypothetical protein
VWLCVSVVEVMHGIARTVWLAPIPSDYNLVRGGLLPSGLLVLTAAPCVAAKVRRVL